MTRHSAGPAAAAESHRARVQQASPMLGAVKAVQNAQLSCFAAALQQTLAPLPQQASPPRPHAYATVPLPAHGRCQLHLERRQRSARIMQKAQLVHQAAEEEQPVPWARRRPQSAVRAQRPGEKCRARPWCRARAHESGRRERERASPPSSSGDARGLWELTDPMTCRPYESDS